LYFFIYTLIETQAHPDSDLLPQIVNIPNGTKEVRLSLAVPEITDPSKVQVSVKDRDLIVKAEDKQDGPDGKSKFYYYKRTTLPENTDFRELKCNLENGKLSISAPLHPESAHKKVKIEHKKHSDLVPK
jgi:HSP20 family molecular chaperone IbpA